jgi:hypothetical protein
VLRAVMCWFRSNGRWGGLCAMFALAFQIVTSFAHVHAWGFGPHPVVLSSGVSGQPVRANQPPHRPSLPAPSVPGRGDDGCPICALIHLVTSSLLPLAPLLPLLTVVAGCALPIAMECERNISIIIPFQARAPPSS